MSGVEEKSVTIWVEHIVGVIAQELRKQNIYKVCATIAPPGCPDFAFSTIEAARIRILSAALIRFELVAIIIFCISTYPNYKFNKKF